MTPAPALVLRPGPDAGKAVLKKYSLTGPQMEVLRNAARKWKNGRNDKEGLHDGQISTFGTHSTTLEILTGRGFLFKEHLHSAQERANRAARSNEIARKAFLVARNYDPYELMQSDSTSDIGVVIDTPVWQVVLEMLNKVKDDTKENQIVVTRITDQGRAIVDEFKTAIGAEEE